MCIPTQIYASMGKKMYREFISSHNKRYSVSINQRKITDVKLKLKTQGFVSGQRLAESCQTNTLHRRTHWRSAWRITWRAAGRPPLCGRQPQTRTRAQGSEWPNGSQKEEVHWPTASKIIFFKKKAIETFSLTEAVLKLNKTKASKTLNLKQGAEH